jgi:CPA2 family monovalent cation:H+ antiporter-2
MPHAAPLISTIVAGFVLAFIFGAIANRLRLPPLVGYLVAGIIVGPYSPGFVADTEIALELSEIGVVLLMFGVGLHFSLEDLISVQAVAVPGALVRIIFGTAMGIGLGAILNWPIFAGVIFGLALSVSSTVVLIKALQDRHLVDSERGRIATGWVIVEDIAMILALVLIPALAGLMGATAEMPPDPFVSLEERMFHIELGLPGVLAVTALKLAAFIGFMFIVGKRLIPMVLHYTAHTGSRELFRLAVLAIALGVAAGAAYLFGVSLALGAFFAGMILSESELSHRAAEESLPLRDAFSVLFFVSVGMLFDPSILWRDPLPVLGTLFIILIGRTIIAYFSLIAFRRPAAASLSIAATLAQIGEFSFILATLGLSLGILPLAAQDYIVAGAIISIFLNPLMIWASEQLRPMLESKAPEVEVGKVEPAIEGEAIGEPIQISEEEVIYPTALTAHTVLIGYGRVGTVVAEGLKAASKPFLVIEDAENRIAAARAAGIEVVVGNAASSRPLRLANVEGASTVIIAIPNAFEAGQAVEQCRRANPNALIIARAHSDEEDNYLRQLGANLVIMGEREIGMAMLDLVNRDRNAVATITGLDAVEKAIMPKGAVAPPPGPVTPSPPPEPVVAAPAPAPVADAATEVAAILVPAAIEPAPPQAVEPVPVPKRIVRAAPEPAADPAAAKARRPARTAATPFNPEVVPDEGEPVKD